MPVDVAEAAHAHRAVIQSHAQAPAPAAKALSPRSSACAVDASGHLTTVVQRDIRDIAQIRQAAEIPRMLALLAGRTAQTVRTSALAEALGMDPGTVTRYLPLLEQVYLIHWLPAWSNNLTARAARTPKMHFVDTGIAAKLVNRSPQSLAQPGAAEAGPLFESFVVGEIMKQAALAESTCRFFTSATATAWRSTAFWRRPIAACLPSRSNSL